MASSYSETDDGWHEPTSDHPYWTETSYWGFYNPQRRLSGTVYNLWRRNLGLVASNVWVWDEDADLPYEAAYTRSMWHLQIPTDADPTNFTLPTGLRCERIAGLRSHRLRYDDPGELSFDVLTEAVQPANASFSSTGPGTGHFDQHIRVVGSLRLGEEDVAIDCISMRDRTWSPRPDLGLPTVLGSYLHGAASPDECFLAMARGGEEHMRTGGPLPIAEGAGYVVREGKTAQVVSGRVTVVERDRGRPQRLAVEVQDALGRTLEIEGTCLNRIGTSLSPGIFNWFSLFRWEYADGTVAHGEDQETWMPPTAFRRYAGLGLGRGKG